MRRWFVLIASLFFYATWGLILVALPLAISLVTWCCALIIAKDPKRNTVALGTGIVAVVCILGYFKYLGFLISIVHALVPSTQGRWGPSLEMVLPLGISFYSFEAVSYLLDVSQTRVKKIVYLDLLLFILFWPHLMAGPIVRARELMPQLKFDRPFDARFLWEGCDRVLLGLVQKNFLANSLGGWVDDGFLPKVAAANSTLDVWALAVAFGMQVYFDFSAYTNIAIGSARLLGLTLPENFNYPYWAATPPDFWSRWHMTLSRWVRDYLFFPINAKHHGRPAALYVSIMAIMALVGLWHGAGWGFVLWGAMHGGYIVAFRLFESWRGDRFVEGIGARVSRLVWRAFTLAAVTVAWVPFRSASLSQTLTLLKTMLLKHSLQLSYSVNFYLVIALMAIYCLAEPFVRRSLIAAEDWAFQRRATTLTYQLAWKPILYCAAIVLFVAFDDQDTAFIYFQF